MEADVPAVINKPIIEVGIIVRDSEKSLAFYRDVLGLPFLGDLEFPGTHMWRFDGGGGSVVKLLEMDPAPVAVSPAGDVSASGLRYLSLYVGNIRELVEECRAAGSTIAFEPTEFAPGTTFAMIEDPDGNRVELLDIVD
jgi:catechol 2,3-dioxygenase-like lactoylglutathione lyase family enzyme